MSAISCPVLITFAVIDDVVKLLKDEMNGANPFMLLTFNACVASVLNDETMGANPLILLTRKSFT